jgi:hypothetical protein
LTIVTGDFNLGTGEEVTVAWTTGAGFTIAGADMGLFLPTGNLSNPAVMEDFTQWGSGGNGNEFVAVAKGIWGAGDFVPLGFEYSYTGSGFQDGVSYWQESEFCPMPSDGIASTFSTTGADLSWTENGSATSWDLEIGLADFTPSGTPTNAGVTIPYAFTGAEGTVYDFFVRSDCAASGGIGLSGWAGPFRFTVPLPVSFCDVAIDVSVGGTFNTGFIDGVYEDFESCMGSSPTNANWFVYSATVNGTLNISSVGLSSVDTEVSVGVGTCGSLTEIACDDDFTGSSPYESEVEFDVSAGTAYYIMWGNGWTSNASDFTVTFTPDLTCSNPFPGADEASLATVQVGNAISTAWTPVPGQIGCQVQVRLAGGPILGAQIVGGANAGGFNIPLNVLQLGTDYEWRVRCGCSQTPLIAGAFSSWQPFSTPAGAGITSSPNPTAGQSNVTFTVVEEGTTTLEVFDLSGRLVDAIFTGVAQPNNDYRFEFDGSALPNGVYIYRLTTESEMVNEKFMIAR